MPDNIHRKTRPSFYTQERVTAARKNIETHDWAACLRNDAVEAADDILARGLETLWSRVTGQAIPRAADPGDGSVRNRWTADKGTSWTMTDGDAVLPTNDFGAYRESGRDDRGFFDPDLADDSLLVNERYPDKPDDWGVDDGTGWTDNDGDLGEPGNRYIPVAFWNHWGCWYGIADDVRTLRDAYLYTGEREYARAASVILDRIADVYPEMDISTYPDPPFYNSHGSTGQGRLIGSIWETNLVRDFAAAYDAVFSGQDDRLVAVLAEKARRYDALPRKESLVDVRRNIEENLVTELLPAVRDAEVRGNLGMHQSALAMAAVVMDEPAGFTQDALEFVFQAGGLRKADGAHWDVSDGDYNAQIEKDWVVTGGDIEPALVDTIDRDGYGNEAAPNYNTIIQTGLRRIADILKIYDAIDEVDVDADLYNHPKFRRIMAAHIDLVLLGAYTPSIGDSGKTGEPGIKLDKQTMLEAFEQYGDPVFAQTASLLNDDAVDTIHGSIFDDRAGTLGTRIQSVIEEAGPLELDSTLLPAYGFAALRNGSQTGEEDTRRALTTYFGRNSGDISGSTTHPHQDALSIELYAHDLDLTPDLGYPERTADWPKAVYWTKNTVSHNTVVVDEGQQHPHRVGTPHLFGDDGTVGVSEIAAPSVYPQTDCYRRTSALIDINETDSYAVDVFRVDGGDRHEYSFHGAEGKTSTQGPNFVTQAAGTYAGPDIPKPKAGEVTAYDERVGSGFNYLTNVKRAASPESGFEVTWDIYDTWEAHGGSQNVELQLTMLGDYDGVALADGRPPANKSGNPESLRYLLVRRSGEDIRSAFTAVLEPYSGSSRITGISEVPVTDPTGKEVTPFRARAVRVELETGRTDYIVSATDPTVPLTVEDTFEAQGRFAVFAERDGNPVYARLMEGTKLRSLTTDLTVVDRPTPNIVSGEVVGFTRELTSSNQITLKIESTPAGNLYDDTVGRHLFVEAEADDGWNAVYRVQDASVDGGRVVLDVGDATTVKQFQDPTRRAAGFEYALSTGVSARIPLDVTWKADP